MSDTGEALSDAEDLKRVVRAARGKSDDQQIIIMRDKGGDGGFAKLKDAVLLAAILGLVATVWNMSITLAKLETTVTALVAQITTLEARIKP